MTLGSYLAALEKKNPAIFKAEKICISVDSLKEQLARAFQAGYYHCLEDAKSNQKFDPDAMLGFLRGFGNP